MRAPVVPRRPDPNVIYQPLTWTKKMIKQKTSKQKLLPLALLPLFSVAVLAGCGSDDDDDGGAVVTPPAEEGVVIGDADGNGVADAF